MQTSYTCFINREQDMTIFKKIDNVIVGMDPSISKATAAPDWDVNFFFFGVQVSIVKNELLQFSS